jgi:5-methylcytosine-specific restriction endonuclease McrA
MNTKQLHKQWRTTFREGVFERDGHKCKVCGNDGELDAHHITDRHDLPNGGYVFSNGISLCSECHIKAGVHHVTGGKDWPDGFHPDDLYRLIHSSQDLAYEDSKRLSE